jgi:hypothetical protein
LLPALPCRRGIAAVIDRLIVGSVEASGACANEFILLNISISCISIAVAATASLMRIANID